MNKASILIVDDEPANIAVLSQMLNQEFTVFACKSGEQLFRFMKTNPDIDLILLDVMMPDMDGYQVLTKLHSELGFSNIPVIFVTSLEDELDEEKGLRIGAVDYLTKPVKPAILLARTRAHVEIKRARDSLAHQNAWLESEVARRTQENLLIQNVSLSVILELAETRDSDTGNHIYRTQAYVEALARHLKAQTGFASLLDDFQLARIVKAAPLHDIGKIGIKDSILLKPGKLDPEEWDIMKTHTTLGGEAIQRAMRKACEYTGVTSDQATPEAMAVLDVAQCIAISHHEKWDGSGYPQGLAGEAIPMPARLMALADVYDALTMPRVYKEPWHPDKAAAYIIDQRALHFDPLVVDTFAALQPTFENIRNLLADPEPEE